MPSQTIIRLAAGLVLHEDFTDPTGWVSTSGNFAVVDDPLLISFGYTPIPLLMPGSIGTPDGGGVREFTPAFTPGNSTLYLWYGAGDGTLNPTGNWRPQVASSTDWGLSFTKHGDALPGNGRPDGSGGTNPAMDMGGVYIAADESLFTLYPLVATSSESPIGKGYIPGAPYTSSTWQTSDPIGTYTFRNIPFTVGTTGAFDALSAYVGTVIDDGNGNLLCFYGAYTSLSHPFVLNAGLAEIAGPDPDPGAVMTKVAGPLLPYTINVPENPDVFQHPGLGSSVYVMFQNEGSAQQISDGVAGLNSCRISSSLTNWNESANSPYKWIMHGSPIDGDGSGVCGYLRAVRLPGGGPLIDAYGYVPATFDGFGDGPTNNTGAHSGRRGLWTVLEPSRYALRYNFTGGGDDSPNGFSKALVHSDFTAEVAIDYATASGSANAQGLLYRTQANGDGYRVTLIPGGHLKLEKSTGGTYSTLATGAGDQVGVPNVVHRFKVIVAGDLHDCYLDGELQISLTDSSSPYASGVSIGLTGSGVDARFRLLSVRNGSNITVHGLTSGQTITFRAGTYIPVETATVSGSSYTSSTITHYPITHIEVNGTSLAIPGLGWGGDRLAITSLSASSSSRRRRRQNLINGTA